MKTLLLLRHAKSSWDDPSLSDHDRPLNPRGKRDAPRMGLLLREKKLVPDLILSSTATRARKTAQKVVKSCDYTGKIELVPELYDSNINSYKQVLAQRGGRCERILLVGHNPEFENFLFSLTGCREKMSTAALAHVRLSINCWEEILSHGKGELLSLWRPKELP